MTGIQAIVFLVAAVVALGVLFLLATRIGENTHGPDGILVKRARRD